MVDMASGVDRGRVRPTTATTTKNNEDVAQHEVHIPTNRSTESSNHFFTAYIFNTGHPCYDQVTPVKTRHPLTSITRSYCGLRFTAHRGHAFSEVDCCPGTVFLACRTGGLAGQRAKRDTRERSGTES